MLEGLESWRRRPSTRRGLARMDDEMSASLVALVAEAAQMQGAVLGCLNDQSVRTDEGEQTSSGWALAPAAALVEWRPTLEFSDPDLVVPLGEVVRDSADEAAVDTGAGVGDLHSAARRRDALPDAEAETRVVAGLSRNAALMRRRLERRGLEALADGRFVGPKLTAKACALTVAKLLVFLLLKAAMISGVGAAQVVTLWWAVRWGEGAEGRYARAVCTATGQAGMAIAVGLITLLFQITKSTTAATALRALSLLVPPMLPLVVWAAYFRRGGEAQSASAYAVAATLSLACAVEFTLTGVHLGSTIHHMPVNEASRNAVVALHAVAAPGSAGAAPQRARRSRRKAVTDAVKAALPGLFVVAAGMVFIFGIFAAYRAAPTSWLKTIVYSIALGTKISGNKAQLWLMHRMPHLQPCTADQMAFFYELATALLCRVLVMSMPDANTAALLSVASSLVEVGGRLHFLVRYLVDGMRLKTSDERAAWRERGFWRTLDGNNDNVIEYATTAVSALMLFLLPQLGVFQFATSDDSASDAGRLLTLVALNVLPELLVDGFCLWTETIGGLGPMHVQYWRSMSPLTVLVKACMCYGVTALVLAACLSL
jgi:hypothetical protein